MHFLPKVAFLYTSFLLIKKKRKKKKKKKMFVAYWVLLSTVAGLFFGPRNWVGKHLHHVLNLILLCLMLIVWKECNSCTFEDIERPIDQLISLLI